MGDVIYASFGRQPKITARDFLESAERNERAAIDFPDLSRPFLSLAGQRRRQAALVQKLAEGAS
jgi:hypothetical protein